MSLNNFKKDFDGVLVDFSGVKKLKHDHLCPFIMQYMGDILIIQNKIVG